jgi:hypothetical protein
VLDTRQDKALWYSVDQTCVELLRWVVGVFEDGLYC